MRHGQKGYKLGRTQAHRQATLAALSTALIKHKRIRTTWTKAKALRMYVEPLITRSKEDTTHNRRQVFRYLQDKHAVSELFGAVSEQVGDRPGGYTRVVKLGQRGGDGAEMAIIELVDFNESDADGEGGGRRRTRRGGGRGRRRKGAKRSTETQAATTTTTVETEQQVAGDEVPLDTEPKATVEEPVADEVTEPVTERTDDAPEGIEEDAVAEARAITEEAAQEPEAATEEAEPEAAEEPKAAAEATDEEVAEEPEAAEEPAEEEATEEPEASAEEDTDEKEKGE